MPDHRKPEDMTDDQIRETCAKAMGWSQPPDYAPYDSWLSPQQVCFPARDLPDPRHDIADAIKLLEKVCDERGLFAVITFLNTDTEHSCSLYATHCSRKVTGADDPSLPAAITFACIRAGGAHQ